MKMFINDTVGMITTDGFATTRVHTPIVSIKHKNGSIQAFRLPLELEYWVLSSIGAASLGKIRSSVKLFSE